MGCLCLQIFPRPESCYPKIPPIVGFLWYLTFPNTGIFLSLYVPNIRDFIVSNLLQRWDLAGFKLTITQIFPRGQGFLNCMIKFPQFPPPPLKLPKSRDYIVSKFPVLRFTCHQIVSGLSNKFQHFNKQLSWQ